MPMVDMPLEQLRQYEGITPCPEYFDAYWTQALDEMRAVDPQVALTPAAFQASGVECFDLTFTGVGGARIYAKYLRPVRRKMCPAQLFFHGYMGNTGDWSDYLGLALSGVCVAAMDCRGQGGRSQDAGGVSGTTGRGHIIRGLEEGPHALLFRRIMLDTAQLAALVMHFDEVDPARVGTAGGSQGGGLALACASLEPRIDRVAAQYPFLCDYQRVWVMDLAKDAYEELLYYFRAFDPLHEREQEIFTTLGYIDIKNMVHRIRGKVLFAATQMDVICPPSTQFAAFNRITAPKELVLYPDFGHELLPGWSDRVYQFFVEG